MNTRTWMTTRDRALWSLRGLLSPSGALYHPEIGPSEDLAAIHKLPLALAACGHLGDAHRVLDHVRARHVSDEGELWPGSRTVERDDALWRLRGKAAAWIGLGALAAGRSDLVLAALRYAGECRDRASGGFFTHGPGARDGICDLRTTALLGLLHLRAGHANKASGAAVWVARIVDDQPDEGRLLLRRNAEGRLIRDFPDAEAAEHVLRVDRDGQAWSALGIATAFLAQAAVALDNEAFLQEARRFHGLAERCEARLRETPAAYAVAWGAAWLARIARDRGPLDVASRLLDSVCAAQEPSGLLTWGANLTDRVERTAAGALGLTEALAALGECDDRRVTPRPAGSPFRLVLCNAPADEAPGIARTVVEERLVACVNILPGVRSIYQWQGKVADEPESTMLMKTRAEVVPALTARIAQVHSYTVPEVIALDVHGDEGEAKYLRWLIDEVPLPGAAETGGQKESR
jgi:periplasmic divalent cation tolerance protein